MVFRLLLEKETVYNSWLCCLANIIADLEKGSVFAV
jgi:hypothetical protein